MTDRPLPCRGDLFVPEITPAGAGSVSPTRGIVLALVGLSGLGGVSWACLVVDLAGQTYASPQLVGSLGNTNEIVSGCLIMLTLNIIVLNVLIVRWHEASGTVESLKNI